jgi:hypothetical protein
VTDRSVRTLRELGLLHALWHAQGKDGARPKSSDEVVGFHFSNAKVTEAALKELADFHNLAELDLSHMKLKVGLKELAGLKKLTTLNLSHASLTAAAVKDLIALEQLETLHFYSSGVSVPELKELADLKRLRKLYLNRAQLSNESLRELQQALPKVEIIAIHPC